MLIVPMLAFAFLPAFANSVIINATKMGLNTIHLKQTDLAVVDLSGRLGVFLELPFNSFSAGYRATSTEYTQYFPVSVPAFIVTGWAINFRCLVRRAHLRFWLLDASVCPDPTNIAVPHTEHLMSVETGLAGPLCVFPSLAGSAYRTSIETGQGLPVIAFYSARGGGRAVKTCRGESDICLWDSRVPFFMSLQGSMKVNFSYQIDGFTGGAVHCSIKGIPTVDGAQFVDAAPKIDNLQQPWCLSKAKGLVWSSIGMVIALTLGLAFAIALKVILGKGGLKQCRLDKGGGTCIKMRRVYEDCV
jgi:hypothetical protein